MYQVFHQVWYQGIVKATVSGVFENLKFRNLEGLDQNLNCPESALLAVSVYLDTKLGETPTKYIILSVFVWYFFSLNVEPSVNVT